MSIFDEGIFGPAIQRQQQARPAPQPIPPLTPEEQDSLISQVGSGALHGLGYLGASLSKAFGGRAIRGAIGGKPNELLSIIPFSDAMGLTNPAEEVHGSDLLGGNKDTPFLSPEGIGGLGIDIITDPATWFGGAIVKGIGKGASAAGSLGAKFAPKTAATIKSAYDPVKRLVRAGFDPEVRGLLESKAQELAPGFTRAETAGREAGRLKSAQIARKYGPGDLVADPQGLRNVVEGSTAQSSAGAQAAAAEAGPYLDRLLNRARWLGESPDELANYFPRQAVQPELDVAGDFLARGGRSREKILQMGTDKIEAMVKDPVVGTAARTAPSEAAAAAHLVQAYGVAPAEARDLAQFLYSLHPERQKFGLFARDAMQDLVTHAANREARIGMLGEMYSVIGKEAGAATPGSTTVKEFLEKVGLSPNAQKRAYEALDQAGKLVGTTFEDLHLPKEVSNALGAIIKPDFRKDGDFVKLVKGLIDLPSNLFRGHVTNPFPTFHSRNAVTSLGWIQTVLTGSPKAALEGNAMMTDLLRGGVIKGIKDWPAFKSMGLTDAQVSEHVSNWMFAKGLTQAGSVADTLGSSAAQNILESIPGMAPGRNVGLSAAGDFAKNWLPRSVGQANPLNMRGVGGLAESTFAPAAAGEKLATVIEQTGRGGGALALLKQGVMPDMAAAMSKAAHVDYTNLTAFEREVMRRLVPFYSWVSRNLPNQLRELITNPGGLTGQAVKASATAQGKEPVPDYLGTGSILNLGKTAAGNQRYVSGLGLPFEDLGNLMGGGRMFGQFNPLLKYGIEQMTGQQLHSGRQLSDVHPLPSVVSGVAPGWVENAIANSPLTRYTSTLRNVMGNREGPLESAANLLIPGRLTDVNPERNRSQAIRQYAEDLLKAMPESRTMARTYIPAESRGQLTPEQMRILRLYQTAGR